MALAGVTPMAIDAAAAIAAAAAAAPAAAALAPPVAATLQVPGVGVGVVGVPAAALPGGLPVMVPSLSGAGVVSAKPKDDSDEDRDNMPLSRAFAAALARPVAAVAAAQVAAAAAAASSSSAAGAKRKRDSGKDKKTKSPAGGARGSKRGAAAKAAAAIADNDDSDGSESDGSDDDGKRKKKGPAKKRAKKGDDGSSDDEMEQEDDEDGGKKKGGSKKEKPMDAEERKRISEMIRNASEYEMLAEAVQLHPTMGANKWWNRERNKKVKWETLEHNGMLFHEPYQPHGVKLKYDGKELELTTDEEEIATYYAAMINTEHVKNVTFNKNFFRDWTKVLKKSGKDKVIRDLDKVDFTPIAKHIATDREEKKVERKRPEVRKALKKEKDRLNEIYGFAVVDGYREKVANYKVEPPGLFRGRGAHPKTGTLKRRIKPEDVTINIGKGVKIPRAPDGHTWKGVLHNQAVTWLAYYNDTFGDFKYIWLAASSRFKGASDLEKYEKARKLKDYIDQIRSNYDKEMSHKNIQVRQRATAIYLIDVLALRVGNEKDKSEVADTVGCCSLRVEHLTFTEEGMKVKFDFLGKDSMRYENEVTVKEAVFKNLRDFCSGKKKDEDIFDRLTTAGLNDHLKTIMPGLTAKVFRTYNASITLENELNKANHQINIHDSAADKILHYHKANREVAILCNHQRSAPKGFDVAMQSLLDTQKDLENLRDDLNDHITYLEKGRGPKPVRRQQPKKPKVKEEGAAAAAAGAGADAKKKAKKEEEDGEPKLQKLPDDVDKARAALKRVETKLDAHEKKIEMKQDSKTVALGTAKINYMDPRITVAWCKAKHVPIEKIFNKSLLSKFPWAMEVPATWTF